MSWEMYAHRVEGGPRTRPGTYYEDIGSRSYCEAHGNRYPVVKVRLTEAPADTPDELVHWGWMFDTYDRQWIKPRDQPEMIYPAKFLLEMCMPYGIAAEEKAGHGRVIRLLVEEIPDGD